MDCKGSYSFSCESWTIPKLSERTKAAMWAAAFNTNPKRNWKRERSWVSKGPIAVRTQVEVWPHCGRAENERGGDRGSKGELEGEGRDGAEETGGSSSGAWNMLDAHTWASCIFHCFLHSLLVLSHIFSAAATDIHWNDLLSDSFNALTIERASSESWNSLEGPGYNSVWIYISNGRLWEIEERIKRHCSYPHHMYKIFSNQKMFKLTFKERN